MTIASQLQDYADGLEDAYDAVSDMQGTIPQDRNMDNLDTAIRTIPQNLGPTYTAGNGISIDANNEISIDTTVVAEVSDLPSDFTGATSSVAGAHGLVPAPTTSDVDKYLKGDGTWATVQAGSPALTVWLTHSGNTYSMWAERAGTTAISIADVYAAFEAGRTVIFREKPYTTDGIATLVSGTRYQSSSNYTYKFFLSYINLDAVNDGGVSVRSTWTTLLSKAGTNGSGNQMTGTLYDSSVKTYDIAFDSPNQGEVQILNSGTPLDGSGISSIQSTNALLWSMDSVTYEENYYTIVDKFYDGLSPALYVTNGTKTYKFLWVNSYDNYGTYSLIENQEKLVAGANISIAADGKTISATDTTYSAFTGATSSVAGSAGLVPAPTTSDPDKFLKGDGTWGTPASGSAVTVFTYDSGGNLSDASSNYATAQDVLTALGNGKVVIGDIIDYPDSAYEIVSSDSDSYFVAVSRYANGSPEFVTLHYDSTFPTAPTGAWTRTAYIPQQKLTAGTNVSISGNTISATDTTYSAMTGATASVAGTSGLVPAPAAGDQDKVLKGDGTWGTAQAQLVEMSYGESNAWAKFIAAYQAKSIVYCGASSNANPGSGAKTRRAFMAYVNNETNPTEVEFQYVRSVGSKTSSQPVDQVFVYKLTSANGGTWSVQTRDMAPKLSAGTNTSVSYSSGTYTVSATDTTYSNMTGATSGTAGAAGLVPAPAAGSQDKFLKGDGTWATTSTPTTFYWVENLHLGTEGLYSDSGGTIPVDDTTVANAFTSNGAIIESISGSERILSMDNLGMYFYTLGADTVAPVTYEYTGSGWIRS